ncbi:MAG: hypothetical protein AB8F95_16345, partial [Bacteroidia bacterium]
MSYFKTDNPPVGAVFTYYLKEAPKTMQQERRKAEKKLVKEGKDVDWPSWDDLRKEDNEEKAKLVFTVRDAAGKVVRRLTKSPSSGMHRVVWDFHYPSTSPVSLRKRSGYSPYASEDKGPRAAPGNYTVELAMIKEGAVTQLVDKQSFKVVPLNNSTLPAKDMKQSEAFLKRVAEVNRAVSSAGRVARELNTKVNHIEEALKLTPSAPLSMMAEVQKMKTRLRDIRYAMYGDPTKSRRQFTGDPTIAGRIGTVEWTYSSTRSEPTETMKQQVSIVEEEFAPVLKDLKQIVTDIAAMEKKLESIGAPYTPGRMPNWEKP